MKGKKRNVLVSVKYTHQAKHKCHQKTKRFKKKQLKESSKLNIFANPII